MPKQMDNSKSVLVIGGLLVDDIAIAAENIRPRSSNPVTWQHRLGGVATNVARVVATQLPTLLIASIGSDDDGKRLTRLLEQQAVSTSLVEWRDESSDRYTAVLAPDGELYIGLADARLVERMAWSDIHSRLPAIAPDAMVLDANLSVACLTETLEAIHTHYGQKIPVYALTVSPVKALRWAQLASQIDVLLCNRREAAAMSNLPTDYGLDAFANVLLKQGFHRFVITDAAQPILIQDGTTRSQLPVADIAIERCVNGAGDALAGASIAKLVNGFALSDAAEAALDSAQAVLSGDAMVPSL